MNVTPMSRQEILDTVWRHARKQGVKCENAQGLCQLEIGELRCFIGALMPATHIGLKRSATPDYLVSMYSDLAELWKEMPLSQLDGLRHIHDIYEPHKWEGELISFAKRHGLKPLPN